MRRANVERVHGYLVPNSCMQIVRCRCRKVAYVTIHANARNMASAALEHGACSCKDIDNYGYRCEAQQDRIMPNTFISSKQINIMSSFKSNEA